MLCAPLDLSDDLSYYFDTLVHVISQTFQDNLFSTSNVLLILTRTLFEAGKVAGSATYKQRKQ